MNHKRHPDSQDHHQQGEKIHLQTPGLEGVEESRSDLKSDGEHEKNQSEILHER